MKKRLLSAALALAMVLTLLPVSVFAAIAPAGSPGSKATETAPASGYTQVQYFYGTQHNYLKADGTPVIDAWAWQWTDTDGTYGTANKTYWASDPGLTGIVTGTGASGTYYADLDDFTNTTASSSSLRSTSFTIVGKGTIQVPANVLTVGASLQVNVFGGSLTFGAGAPEKINSLIVTDTWYTQYGGTRGSVTIARTVTPYTAPGAGVTPSVSTSGLNLNVTGATVAGLSLTGRANTVTLTDVDVTGGITLNGATTVNGTTPTNSYERQSLTINPKQTPPYTYSTIAGNIAVYGNGSTVALNGVTGTSTVNVTGVGGTVTAGNGTNLGMITVATGTVGATNPTLALTSAPATVTINDATVAGISYTKAAPTYTGASTFTVNANGKVTGPISTENGTVNLNSANVNTVTVEAGTLNIAGANGGAGNITLGGANASKVTFNFSATNYSGKNITKTPNAILTIGSSWPASRGNTFGTLALPGYTGQGIKGGTFQTAADTAATAAWFSPELQFMRKDGANYAYYGKQELATAIADAGATAATAGTLAVIGWKGSNAAATGKEAEFYNSMVDVGDRTKAIATLTYDVSTAIYLPNMVNGTPVATWTDASTVNTTYPDGTAKTYGVNELVSLSTWSSGVKLVIQSSGAAVTRLTNATAADPNQNITVTMSGNQITLSGAVGQAAFEDVKITCTTDLIGTDGLPVTFPVIVSYDTNTKVAAISTLGITPPPLGVVINTGSNTIVVGDNTYTISVSGLAKPASDLQVAGITTGAYANTKAPGITGKGIVVTVNVAGMGNTDKTNLINALSGTGSEFDWTASPAMQQVVNQAMTTITTNNQIDNWATAAQRAAWNLNNKGKSPTEQELISTGYTTVLVEPYLAMTVTAFNQNGTMTANLVPSYRVIVVSSDATYTGANGVAKNKTGFTAEGYYIAQQGRALGTPITDLTTSTGTSGVTIKFAATSATYTGFTANTVMHQDGTYAYKTADGVAFTLTRGGKTGLGTVVLNTTPALVSMTRNATATSVSNGVAGSTHYYDNLQAAVDDTLPQAVGKLDKITVTAAYTGSGTINVTGTARTFEIETLGQTTITNANNNFTVGVDATGHKFTVQLQQSVAAADGNVTLSAQGTSQGTVSVPSSAKVGQTVTVTVLPNAGQTATGVSVVTNTGAIVSAAPTGKANEYTFTVPTGATSITVTPTFNRSATKATVNVASNAQGSATTTAALTDNKVDSGSTVGVTTYPGSGYRTMNVNITTNGGSTTASRVSDNYFTFTVPVNATSVTVTPVYDRDNGTKFTDVWSTEYYSNAVSWAVSKGITNGQSTYLFGSNNYCTRGEMVTFLWRAANSPTVSNVRNPFVDVNPGDYYYNAVLWAVSKGITDGIDATHFGPKQYVTRAQTVTFLYRYENSPAASTSNGFYDVSTKDYFAKAVTWAANKGITNGKTNTSFAPNDACKRCEIVTFLYRDVTGIRA